MEEFRIGRANLRELFRAGFLVPFVDQARANSISASCVVFALVTLLSILSLPAGGPAAVDFDWRDV
jgi:hypothetical protein